MALRGEYERSLRRRAVHTVDGRPEAYVPPPRKRQNELQELQEYAREERRSGELTPQQARGVEQIDRGVDQRFQGMHKLTRRQRWIAAATFGVLFIAPAGYAGYKIGENVNEGYAAVQDIGGTVGDFFDLSKWETENWLGFEVVSPGETIEAARTRIQNNVERMQQAKENIVFHAKWGTPALAAGVVGEVIFAGLAWNPRSTERSVRGRWNIQRGMWNFGVHRPIWRRQRFKRMHLDRWEARNRGGTTI